MIAAAGSNLAKDFADARFDHRFIDAIWSCN
jgi:hypothetical protein